MIDVDRLRADTPPVANLLHIDNAVAALMPGPVFPAVEAQPRAKREPGGYEAARRATAELEAFHPEIAGRRRQTPTRSPMSITHARGPWRPVRCPWMQATVW